MINMSNIKENRLYRIWGHIKTRCFNSNYENFHRYGGRGITMCDEWRNDFRSFEHWALGNGYQNNLSIDRIDNDGNYEPSNCRWVSQAEQNKNTRMNKKFHGKCVSDWAKEIGIDCDLIYARINRLGWDISILQELLTFMRGHITKTPSRMSRMTRITRSAKMSENIVKWHPFDYRDKSTHPKEQAYYLVTIKFSSGKCLVVSLPYYEKKQRFAKYDGCIIAWAEKPEPYRPEVNND